MNADDFQAAAISILRSSIGWQTAIAKRLGQKDARTVRRWLSAGYTPDWVDEKMAELLGQKDLSPWPRDEWMIGNALTADGRDRRYIVHLQPPRFTARVVFTDEHTGGPLDAEQPVDVVSGTVYNASEMAIICEVEWIDQPSPGEVVPLMEAASDAVDAWLDRVFPEEDEDVFSDADMFSDEEDDTWDGPEP